MCNQKLRPEGLGYLCVCKNCVNSGSATKKVRLKRYNRALRKQAKVEIERQLNS